MRHKPTYRPPLPPILIGVALWLVILLLLSGCAATPYWLLEAGHTSSPHVGEPFNRRCDAVADYIGAGGSLVFEHEGGSETEISGTLGAKRILQCYAREHTVTEGSLNLNARHRIPMRRF